jgi:serine phosphatase RsbU (regulator of sigma subunit)
MLGVARLRRGDGGRRNAAVELPRGSILVFFTDGLTDSAGADLDVGEALQRLADIVADQPVGAAPRDLVAALVEQSDGGRVDDIAVIAVRVD